MDQGLNPAGFRVNPAGFRVNPVGFNPKSGKIKLKSSRI